MPHPWIAHRTTLFDSSGIRKVFELAAAMTDPINFSIGQPDFDVPEEARQAAIDAIQSRKNSYSVRKGFRRAKNCSPRRRRVWPCRSQNSSSPAAPAAD